MSKTIKTIPKLRFPEFRDAPEWEEKKLSEVCKFVRGPFGGSLKKDIFVKDGYAVYEQSHAIYQNFDIFRYYITEEKFNELKRFSINPNDIIMSCSGTMGKFAIIPKNAKEGVINQALLKLTVKKEFDNSFVKITLELPINQEKLLSQSAGGAIKNVVSVDQIKDMVIYMPYYLEQQKIADCLSSVDELIIAQSAKVEALKAHKKALMQQLFPADGETTPRLRFPEFTNAPEWEEKKIEQVCKKPYSGGTPTTSQKEYYGGAIPFIRSAEIGKDKTELFLTELGLNNSSAKIVKKGVVLVALYGANSGDVAVSKIEGAINQAILCLDSEESNEFLYHYLTLKKNWIISTYIQGGQGNLSGDIIKSIELCFPQPNEQQKIADCLSSIDELIVAQSTKVEALKTHKKALMQQLFPTSKEM